MLIETLMDIFYSVFAFLLTPIDIPNLPDKFYDVIDVVFGYMSDGIAVLSVYTHIEYLTLLFSIIIAVDVGMLLYRMIMWILRKIPLLSIS